MINWKRNKCDNGMFPSIMDSLGKQKSSNDWTKENGQWIPMGSAWVEGKRWEDETEQTTSGEGRYDRCQPAIRRSTYRGVACLAGKTIDVIDKVRPTDFIDKRMMTFFVTILDEFSKKRPINIITGKCPL